MGDVVERYYWHAKRQEVVHVEFNGEQDAAMFEGGRDAGSSMYITLGSAQIIARGVLTGENVIINSFSIDTIPLNPLEVIAKCARFVGKMPEGPAERAYCQPGTYLYTMWHTTYEAPFYIAVAARTVERIPLNPEWAYRLLNPRTGCVENLLGERLEGPIAEEELLTRALG